MLRLTNTTAIQSQDFFFRKIARDQGVALRHVLEQIQQFLDSDTARPELADNRKLLAAAVEDLQAMGVTLTGYLLDCAQNARELYRVGMETVQFMLAVGDVLVGWLLLQQAEIALNALDGDPASHDRALYTGKAWHRNVFREHRASASGRPTADRRRCRPDDHGNARGGLLTAVIPPPITIATAMPSPTRVDRHPKSCSRGHVSGLPTTPPYATFCTNRHYKNSGSGRGSGLP